MRKILVTYASLAGSTAEVAQVVGEEMTRTLSPAGAHQGAPESVTESLKVDVLPLDQVATLDGYDAVVIGAPMIVGWHRAALRFLRRHRAALQSKPCALFALALSLTETGEHEVDGMPVVIDPALPKPPARPGRLTIHERWAQAGAYIRPILRAARPARPVSLAIFAGRMEYGRLPWWAVLFAMGVIRAPAGDRRNWPAIRAWAAALPDALLGRAAPA